MTSRNTGGIKRMALRRFFTKSHDEKHPEDNLLSNAVRDIPQVIRQNIGSLQYKNYNFETTHIFKCPCCTEETGKLGLYRPKYASSTNWMIRTFNGCTHFGKNGEYPGDAIGILMAIYGDNNIENAKKAISYLGYTATGLTRGESNINKEEREKIRERIRQKNEKEQQEAINARNRITEKNLAEIKEKTLWGDKLPEKAKNLLKTRGIDTLKLGPQMLSSIGWAERVSVEKLSGDGKYTITGIVFDLGSQGYQLRKVDRYHKAFLPAVVVSKEGEEEKKVRFLTFGEGHTFNAGIFNRADTKKPFYVTEGPIDAVTFEQVINETEHRVMSRQVLSVQGCENEEYLAKEIEACGKETTVFIAFDDDEPGESAKEKMTARLSKIKGIKILPFPGYMGYKDMNEMWTNLPEKTPQYIQMVDAIGSYVADGRLSVEEGVEMLKQLKGVNGGNFEEKRNMTREMFRKAIERNRENNSKKKDIND